MHALVVDETSLISFRREGQQLLLNLSLFSELNYHILRVIDGELLYSTANPEVWDIEWVGKELTFREKRGQILLDITFEPPNTVAVSRGRFRCNGAEIVVTKDYIFVVNNALMFGGGSIMNANVAISVGYFPEGVSCLARIDCPRYSRDSDAVIAEAEVEWRASHPQ